MKASRRRTSRPRAKSKVGSKKTAHKRRPVKSTKRKSSRKKAAKKMVRAKRSGLGFAPPKQTKQITGVMARSVLTEPVELTLIKSKPKKASVPKGSAAKFESIVFKLPKGYKPGRVGNLLTEVLGVMENAKSTPAFESVSAHMGVQPVSLHESVTASLPLLPVVLKLRTEKPKKGEHWKHYKERIADHLEPVRKKIATNMGMEATPLIAANALKFLGTEEQIKVLTNDSVIEKIEFDPLLQIVAMNDAILDISQPPFAQTHPGVDGSGVKVALLDSGVDTQHPYLSVAASVSTCGESFDIPGRHGTHCAGSIASKDTFYRGVAPGVTLFNVKVLQADGRGTHTNVVKGIDEALDLGAEVLSMSLGFNHLPTWSQGGHGWMCTNGHCPLCTAVDNAILLDNVIVVVAAGNEHARAEFLRTNGFGTSFDTELGCPGNSRQAITVGAITKVTFLPAPFSSRGPTSYNVRKPDIAAAGVNITSTVPIPRDPQGNPISNAARNDLFSRLSGTSMATPIVAGVVAVIVQQLKASGLAVTPAAVKSRLLSNGITTVSGATAFEVGGGRVNMQNL